MNAEGEIRGDRVVVWSPNVRRPVAVRPGLRAWLRLPMILALMLAAALLTLALVRGIY